jgi:hypothetical protein
MNDLLQWQRKAEEEEDDEKRQQRRIGRTDDAKYSLFMNLSSKNMNVECNHSPNAIPVCVQVVKNK